MNSRDHNQKTLTKHNVRVFLFYQVIGLTCIIIKKAELCNKITINIQKLFGNDILCFTEK